MLSGLSIAVVVPAHNEDERVGEVVRTLPSFIDHVFVVDDASSDATSVVARDHGADVFNHSSQRGVGAAISTGYAEVLRRGIDVAVVMAGDGQMDPDDLEPLLRPIVEGHADYVKGNRFRHADIGHTMPVLRYRVGQTLSLLTRLATGANVSDTQCGYTAITRHALRAIESTPMWTGYGYPNDLIGILARAGQRIAEVTVRPVYRGERSGLRPWHVLKIVRIIAKSGALRAVGHAQRASLGSAWKPRPRSK